jgi:mannose-6-phosphate isomerase
MSESRHELYPLTFSTIYIEKPWGGRTLEKYKGALPDGLIGETWDVSAQAEGVSLVTNGHLRGSGLDEVVQQLGRALLGTTSESDFLPLMVRHVSSRENLSVQVHPTREYAVGHGELSGKDEAWYVLEAEPGAFVYAGVDKGVSAERFRESVVAETVREHLIAHPVAAGDCLFIPAGMIHAICAGVTLIEICENSNTTYRVYDYGRDRGLDFVETFANMNLTLGASVRRGLTRQLDAGTETVLCVEPTMGISRLDIHGRQAQSTGGLSFHALSCLTGSGVITWNAGADRECIERGQSVLIPAEIGRYELSGTLSVLRSWIPDDDERARLLDDVA